MPVDQITELRFVPVKEWIGAERFLYDLLAERSDGESISHRTMPLWGEHCLFVHHPPYLCWDLLIGNGEPIGAVYVTTRYEIGIGILNAYRRCGYAHEAIQAMRARFPDQYLYANINARNTPSIQLFTSEGFGLLAQTYVLPPRKGEDHV